MKNILAFGDSNTWGLIPGTKERYPGEELSEEKKYLYNIE